MNSCGNESNILALSELSKSASSTIKRKSGLDYGDALHISCSNYFGASPRQVLLLST